MRFGSDVYGLWRNEFIFAAPGEPRISLVMELYHLLIMGDVASFNWLFGFRHYSYRLLCFPSRYTVLIGN